MSLSATQTAFLQQIASIEQVEKPKLPNFEAGKIDAASFGLGLLFASQVSRYFAVNGSVKSAQKALAPDVAEAAAAPVPDQIQAITFFAAAQRIALEQFVKLTAVQAVIQQAQTAENKPVQH